MHNIYACPTTEKFVILLGFHFRPTKSRGAWEIMELAGAQEDVERRLKTVKVEL